LERYLKSKLSFHTIGSIFFIPLYKVHQNNELVK
jgi:hypothetical protein